MATEYRRIKGRDVWHFHRHCQHWYHTDGLVADLLTIRFTKPKTGELCNECQSKAKTDRALGISR